MFAALELIDWNFNPCCESVCPMNAHAVVFTAPNVVEFLPVTCPEPGPGDLVVRTTHSWISNGTEGSFLRGERVAGDTPYTEADPWPFPIVAGYQKIGIVEWVGTEVTDIAIGETVFATVGQVNGMFSPRGGQLSHSVSPREQIWKLPTNVDPLAFAGLVLTQVGYNCGMRAPLTNEKRAADGAIVATGQNNAVVIGDGLVGQWAAQTLAWRGAEVLLVGRHADRLEHFGHSPQRITVNATEHDWVAVARERWPAGVQIAVDTVGSLAVVEEAMTIMQRYGHIVSAGFYGNADRLALQPLRNRELSLDMVSGWSKERMDATRALVASGELETLPLITHRFPAVRAADAWELIQQKTEPVLGVILEWSY